MSSYSQKVKESAYFTIVHPVLEYASIVWDPYQQIHMDKVQRRSARWVESLNWITLRERRKIAIDCLFYDIVYKASLVNIPQQFLKTTRHICHHHPHHFIHPSANTTAYKKLFPRTIIEWNLLSTSVIEMNDKNLFLDHNL